MTVQHLRHAGVSITSIHDFLVDTIHADDRVVKQYLNLTADQLESAQAELLSLAFKSEEA